MKRDIGKLIVLKEPAYCAYSRCERKHEKIDGLASKVIGQEIYTHRSPAFIVIEDCDFCYCWEQPSRGKDLEWEDVIIKYK